MTFDQAVTVDTSDGTPRIQLRVGGGEDEHLKWADYLTGTGAAVVQFTYVVQTGDFDDNGIDIAADELELNGGTIQSSGGTDANLDYPDQGTQSGHKVDGVLPDARVRRDLGRRQLRHHRLQRVPVRDHRPGERLHPQRGHGHGAGGQHRYGQRRHLLTLGLASALTSDQVVTVAYVDATAGDDAAAVQDAAGNDAVTFTQTV